MSLTPNTKSLGNKEDVALSAQAISIPMHRYCLIKVF